MSTFGSERVFSLAQEDEDLLLDWDLYAAHRARQNRWACCSSGSLPDWWYRLSTQQRRIARVASVSCTGLILLVILLSSTLSTRSNPQPETFPAPTQEPLMPSSGQETTTASGNTQATPVPTPEVDPPPPRPPSIDPFTVPPKTPVSPRNTSAPADGSAMVPLVFSPVAVGSGPGAEHCSWTDYRLPETVKPLKYQLQLTLDQNLTEVTGHVDITVVSEVPTSCIILHAASTMDIGEVTATVDEQQVPATFERAAEEFNLDGQSRIHLESEAPAGNITVGLDFNYTLSSGLSGFYRTEYLDANGTNRVVAATQFESMSARKAFPCLDEPNLKAVFEMDLVSSAPVVLFNTELWLTQEIENSPAKYHVYAPTPPMSTYLVGIVVGELEANRLEVDVDFIGTSMEPYINKLPVTVYNRMGYGDYVGLAKHAAAAAVEGMVSIIGVPYTLRKLDLVGIPDFAAGAHLLAGAMENWGIITFREADLMAPNGTPTNASDSSSAAVRANEPSVGQLYTVPITIAHEIAHMWFGDLVTLPWWTQLWLNEGFATYFESMGAGYLYNQYDPKSSWPQDDGGMPPNPGPFNYLRSFSIDVLDVALRYDALDSSHAVAQNASAVTSEAEAETTFTRIAYEKGASVLRMLHAHMLRAVKDSGGDVDTEPWLLRRSRKVLEASGQSNSGTSDPFFSALTDYLNTNEYSNGDTNVLWESMGESSNQPVLQWMQRWTNQQGFPLLNVARSSDGSKLLLSQQEMSQGMREGPQGLQCGVDLQTPVALPGGTSPDSSSGTSSDDGLVGLGATNGGLLVQPMKYAWWIPVTYVPIDTSGGDSNLNSSVATRVVGEEQFVEMKDCKVEVPWPQGGDAIKVNSGQFGVYRVNYTEELWENLIHAAPVLSPEDLSGVLADTYSLGMAGIVPLPYFLRFAAALPARSNFTATPLSNVDLPLAPQDTPEDSSGSNSSLTEAPGSDNSNSTDTSADDTAGDSATIQDERRLANTTEGGALRFAKQSTEVGRKVLEASDGPVTMQEGENCAWRALWLIAKVVPLLPTLEEEQVALGDSTQETPCRGMLSDWLVQNVLQDAARALGIAPIADEGARAPKSDGLRSQNAYESWDVRLTRLEVARLLLSFPIPSVYTAAEELFTEYLVGLAPIAADVRSSVFAMAGSLPGAMEGLQELYQTSGDPAEQSRALYALSFTPDVISVLEYASSGQVRTQDIASLVLNTAQSSLDRRRRAWLYISMETEIFYERFGGSASDARLAVAQMLAQLGAGFATMEDFQTVQDYFTQEFPPSQGGLPQFALHALDEIRRNVASKQALEMGLCKWLASSS